MDKKAFNKYLVNGALTKETEAQFERDSEKHFRSHPELPNGRDFRFNRAFSSRADKKYRSNFDSVFPNSPGAKL